MEKGIFIQIMTLEKFNVKNIRTTKLVETKDSKITSREQLNVVLNGS